MLLVVGLGNPGADYAGNRHNIGFMAVDVIVRRHGFSSFRAKFEGKICQGEVAGQRIVALKPETYMNESGRSVAAAAGFFKIDPKDILVFHDEIDLAAGKLRVKRGGGHAGHNGLRSIHAHIGSAYRRLRFGIGHPGDKDKVSGHVLKDFAQTEQAWLEPMLDTVADHFALLAGGDDAAFMSKMALELQASETSEASEPSAPLPGDDDGL